MPDEREGFVLERELILPAPPERIFALLTEPAELAKWWGPHGFTTPEIELDLRVGGRYRFTMQPPDGDRFHVPGEFVAIDPPSRLAYTFRWEEPTPDDRETAVTLTTRADAEGTELTLRHTGFATAERVELHRGGWTDSLDKLVALLGPDAQPR